MNKRRALLQKGHFEIRPPWAIEPDPFFKACTACKACIHCCPTHIITADRFGYPLIDFDKGYCLFCRKCVEACETKALIAGPSPWNHAATIGATCLARGETLCRLCGETCEYSAIHFKPQVGGMAPPQINESCTGCGACVAICPVQAISMR